MVLSIWLYVSHIAEALIGVFSKVGIPCEILTDQGSKFTSQVITELYRMLHIHPIRTSPYHLKQTAWLKDLSKF